MKAKPRCLSRSLVNSARMGTFMTRAFTCLDKSEVSQSFIYLCSTLPARYPGDRKKVQSPCSAGDNPYRMR